MQPAQSIASSIIDFLKHNEQYDQLSEIADILQKESYRSKAITVISAVDLSKSEQTELQTTLVTKWGEHPIVFTVDPLIISGMVIRFQDQVIDMSGKNSLNQLASNLKQ